LREKTGAKIFVENDIFEGHQFTRIIGHTHIILNTLRLLNEMVQEECSNDDFERWASVASFRQTAGGARDNNRGDRHSPPRSRHASPHPGSRRDQGRGRDRDMDRFDSDRRGGGGQGHAPLPPPRHAPPPPAGDLGEALLRLASEFPPGATEMDHAISCDLPNNRVGALIGRKGEHVMAVERQTGAKIAFEEGRREQDVEYRTITITGPLLSVYNAHMILMKTYHEKEIEELAKEERARAPPRDEQKSGDLDSLQAQIMALEGQLQAVRGRGGSR